MDGSSKDTERMMKRAANLIGRSVLLLAAVLLSACSFMAAKPVMPIEQGITIYPTAKTPAPTVLLTFGCGAIKANTAPSVVKLFNDNGFNAVVLDFVKIMGLDDACGFQIKPEAFLKLMFDALSYTAAQPAVDRNRIALVGWSLGGSAALTLAEKIQSIDQPNITAVAAYYPGCYSGLQLSTHPTLLLLGLADNVVDANDCLELASKSPQTPLIVKTYPKVHHGFDNADIKQPQTMHFFWKKFTAAYDPVAAADAEKALLEFLKKYNRDIPAQ
jgi:dienelactone hydrolase